MIETGWTCPGCGRALGAQAERCFYCGKPKPGPSTAEASGSPDPSPTGGASNQSAEAVPSPPAAGLRMVAEPNTLCPICRNAIVADAKPAFTCPSCNAGLDCLFAAPVKTAQRPLLAELCTFHPEQHASARCRNCRKAVCETCAFRVQFAVYCPDCASAPDEISRTKTRNRGLISLVCGLGGLFALAGTFLMAIAMGGGKDAEHMATVMVLVSLVLGLVGITMGFMSRDPARGRSITGLIGLIAGFLVLGMYVLLMILGAREGS